MNCPSREDIATLEEKDKLPTSDPKPSPLPLSPGKLNPASGHQKQVLPGQQRKKDLPPISQTKTFPRQSTQTYLPKDRRMPQEGKPNNQQGSLSHFGGERGRNRISRHRLKLWSPRFSLAPSLVSSIPLSQLE